MISLQVSYIETVQLQILSHERLHNIVYKVVLWYWWLCSVGNDWNLSPGRECEDHWANIKLFPPFLLCGDRLGRLFKRDKDNLSSLLSITK